MTYEQYRQEAQDARTLDLLLHPPLDVAVMLVSTRWWVVYPGSCVASVTAAGYIWRSYPDDSLPTSDAPHRVMERGS